MYICAVEALQYETLIKAVHNSADADIYRQMEYAFDILSDNHWGNKHVNKEYSFQYKFLTVRNNVSNALKEGANKIYYEAPPADLAQLDSFITELNNEDFFDKHILDNIINSALLIFKNNGLVLD